GGWARDTNQDGDVGSSNCVEGWAESTNLVSSARAAGPPPSSLLISIRVASPAELCVGSGRLSLMLSGDVWPPMDPSRKFQPAEVLNAGTWAAAAGGITIMSGDLATCRPVDWTACAPSGNVRATSTHRLESGIHASTAGRPALEACPSTSDATAAGDSWLTCTSTHRPAAWWASWLNTRPTC